MGWYYYPVEYTTYWVLNGFRGKNIWSEVKLLLVEHVAQPLLPQGQGQSADFFNYKINQPFPSSMGACSVRPLTTGFINLFEVLEDFLNLRSLISSTVPALLRDLPNRFGSPRGIEATRPWRTHPFYDHRRDSVVHGLWEGNLSDHQLEPKQIRG